MNINSEFRTLKIVESSIDKMKYNLHFFANYKAQLI